MKILFTGASSFTGFWFVRELARSGHDIVAVFQRSQDGYEGVRGQRVTALREFCRPVFQCAFGDETFGKCVDGENRWDVLCHHAADATNYKSDDFDVLAAVAANTRNLSSVLKVMRRKGCHRVVLTGSVFEPDEGAESTDRRAFSPYGLSKGLTWQYVRHYAAAAGMKLGKFVIPNPFGPWEEPRFTSFLAKSWLNGQTPQVKTPAYVRDNIHVGLLARAYADFVAREQEAEVTRLNPSGYRETMGRFTARFAEQMRPRLGVPCEFSLAEQTEFLEPRERTNIEAPDARRLGWDETKAWDELAEYYLQSLSRRGPV